MTQIKITQNQLADAFTEWDRRYREEPERFMSEAAHLLKETPHQYGQACAPYLIKIINEQATDAVPVIPQPQPEKRLGSA